MATRLNDRRTAAAVETSAEYPVSVGTGSETFYRPASFSPPIQSTPGPLIGRVIDLSSLTPSQGFVIQGDSAYDLAGWSVSSAGDVNGDGIDDLIVGAPTGRAGALLGEVGPGSVGEAYVIYGQAGTRGLLDLSTLTASQGFVIRGHPDGDLTGMSVSSAGDVNGDGRDDLIVGAPDGDDGGSNAGQAYVIYGQAGATRGLLDLSTLSASQGFVIQGDGVQDNAGWSVSSAGDVNGDGIDDVIVGARWGDGGGFRSGEAYVVYGQAGTSRGLLDLTTLSASQGFAIQGGLDEAAGVSVSSAGDVNGDGIDDLIVGAVGAVGGDGGGTAAGEAYVIYGQAGSSRGRIDLTTLSASQGFVIQGDAAFDYVGDSVSSAGDVNGDGIDDLILSAPRGDDGGTDAGEAYVIYGQAGTSRGRIDLSTLSASQGFIIQGEDIGAAPVGYGGLKVSSAGDVNGDGIDDLLVGATYVDDGGIDAGQAYVIYGQAGTSRGRVDLSTLSPSQGFIIQGDSPGDFAGYSVSSAGDVNGDGLDDLIVGAPYGDDGGTDAGEAYVVYGFRNTPVPGPGLVIDLSSLTTSQGFVIQREPWWEQAGLHVSYAGDVNSDGIDDVIVGAPYGSRGAYVIYGQSGASRGLLDLSTLSASQGFVIQGFAAGDIAFGGNAGESVSFAGDVNGDGIDDLIVGAPGGDDGGTDAGQAYVIYGQAGASRGLVDVSTLSASQGFVIQGDAAGDLAGWSVSSAGDVNADGIDDLIIGARLGNDGGTHAGEAYVIYGQAGASRGRLDLTSLSASEGFVIQGAAGEDIAGDSVSAAGDVNGDGIDDLIVGAPNGRGGGVQAGETYVIYGQAGTSRGRLDLGTLSASQGFVIQGDVAGDFSGATVSDAGDVNGDGIDDLIVSAPVGSDGGLNAGEAYVIYGQAGAVRGRLDLSTLSPGQGFIIQGKDPGAWIGFGGLTASSAGDVNGDGIDDLIVGSPLGDDGGLNAGQAYVVYGQTGTSRGRLDLGTLSSSEGFIMQGHLRNSLAGFSVSSAGDVNRDGLDDLIVGGTRIGESPTQVPSETYVIYGFGPGWIKGTCDADTLNGTNGANFINGLHGDDVIRGLDGDDVIDGGYGNDRIFAGAGNDTVVGGVGNNVIDGGTGWDVVTVSGPVSAYRILKDGDNFILKGPDGGDKLTNVEAIRFADGKTLDLARMYGPDVDASAWADGRIPEELLSGEGPRPLVWVQETTEKDVMPEVLPAADDAGLDRFGEPGPLIGLFGGGSDPSIPLTLDGDSDDFLTAEGGMNGGDLFTGDTDDRVDVAVVARPQFGGDRVVPSLMNGRERELRVEADGRISEADLSDEKAGGDRPLVLPGADEAVPLTGKGGDRPEVLPGADDGDHWILKDDGEPLVLPGAAPDEVLIAKHGDGPEVLPAVDDIVGSTKAFDGPEVLPAAPVDKFLVEAEVLPPLPGDHFSAEVPEVLPALDDGFLFTGKFDDLPPVMPTLPDEMEGWDVAAVIRPSSETLALILEGAEHPYGQSLTLLDELPAAPSKGDPWE